MTAFADTSELLRILKIRAPTTEQQTAAQRDIDTAYGEILDEIGITEDDVGDLTALQVALCEGVNLDRAADLWRHRESIAGVTGLLGDEGAIVAPARYSWERYAQRLANVKTSWGVA